MKKIAIIGNMGVIGKPVSDGQTIKTRIVTQELIRQYGENEVLIINTHGGKINIIKSPFQCLRALINALNIIILPASNGIRIYAPLLSILSNIIRRCRLHYVVIGGWLPTFIQNKPILKHALRRFYGIYVETDTMKIAMEEQQYNNISIMPNFKDLHIVNKEELEREYAEPYKLCTFSRVMKEKGIEDAVKVVTSINKKLGRVVYTLDIYGKVDPTQTEWFYNLKQTFPEYIRYKGVVDFDQSVEVLKDYFALLFPTYYKGEGFAGTIIDAFAAALPVIASDWRYNSEIIEDGCTGHIYNVHNNSQFESILSNIANNPNLIINLKHNCRIKAQEYLPSNAIIPLVNNIK